MSAIWAYGWTVLLTEEGHHVVKPQGPLPKCSIVSGSIHRIRQAMKAKTREVLEKIFDHRITMGDSPSFFSYQSI